MFEAFVTICLLAAAPAEGAAAPIPVCRTVLSPGYTATTKAACEAGIAGHPPSWMSEGPVAEAGNRIAEHHCTLLRKSRLTFTQAAPGVFVHRGEVEDVSPDNEGDVSNIAFIIGSRSVAVIDAGGSREVGEAVYKAVREHTDLPISHLIMTHMHPDHVFGAEVFREAGAELVGASGLSRALADRAQSYQANFGRLIGAKGFLGSRIVAPDREVEGHDNIDLGGRVLELSTWPTAHTTNDLTVFDPTSSVLFAGDLVFDTHTPALDGSLRGWRAVLSQLATIPARHVVPGHGGPFLDWPAGAVPLAHYLEVLEADTRRALGSGMALSAATAVIGVSEASHWRLFDLFNARNATVAYTELEWE